MGRNSRLLFSSLLVLFLAGCGALKQKPVPLEERLSTPKTSPVYDYQGFIIARGSMHNHTIYSDGCRTAEELVQQARNEGIAVLTFTDHREGRMCLTKNICGDLGGVDSPRVGYKKYSELVHRLANENKGMIIIYGQETVPYLWNERAFPFPLGRGGNWHFTTYGIEDTEVYEEMPARKGISTRKEKEPGMEPYINWVDYMVSKGGFVFLAHPDVADNQWIATVHSWSPAATDFPPKLLRLSGVAITPEGFTGVGKPGGTWDQSLFEYLAGLRQKPLWAWGEADYHCPPTDLRRGTTLFYLQGFSEPEVFKAMEKGMMVALMGDEFQDVFVTEFSVGDRKPAPEKIMFGQSLKIAGAPVIKFSLNKEIPVTEARLIRNGKIVFTGRSANFEFKDEEAAAKRTPVYYRVELEGQGPYETGKGSRLFTNPVFVDWNK